MKEGNWSYVTEFTFLGLTDNQQLQLPLFALFLLFYIITVVGNIGIMALIRYSPSLNSPMYFLLNHLAFVDLCYASIVTPNMLANFFSKRKAISLPGCALQLLLFFFIGGTEVFLLDALAYDRYMAICQPLLYTTIVTKEACIYLLIGAYTVAFMNAVLHTSFTFRLTFCGPNKITNFFCDVPPLLNLSCSDTSLNESLLIYFIGTFTVASFILILISYSFIISVILRIRSSAGRSRTFSTCSSHLLSITLFFGTVFFMHLRPKSSYSLEQDRVVSVFYAIVLPMLNPFIYSLKNQEVKGALRKLIEGRNV